MKKQKRFLVSLCILLLCCTFGCSLPQEGAATQGMQQAAAQSDRASVVSGHVGSSSSSRQPAAAAGQSSTGLQQAASQAPKAAPKAPSTAAVKPQVETQKTTSQTAGVSQKTSGRVAAGTAKPEAVSPAAAAPAKAADVAQATQQQTSQPAAQAQSPAAAQPPPQEPTPPEPKAFRNSAHSADTLAAQPTASVDSAKAAAAPSAGVGDGAAQAAGKASAPVQLPAQAAANMNGPDVQQKQPSAAGTAPAMQQPLSLPVTQAAGSGMQTPSSGQPYASNQGTQALPTAAATASGPRHGALPGLPSQLHPAAANAAPAAVNPVGSYGGIQALPSSPLGTWGSALPQLDTAQPPPVPLPSEQLSSAQLPSAQLPTTQSAQLPSAQLPPVQPSTQLPTMQPAASQLPNNEQPQPQPYSLLQQPQEQHTHLPQQPLLPPQAEGTLSTPLLEQQVPHTTFGSTPLLNTPQHSTFGAAAASPQDTLAATSGLPQQHAGAQGSSAALSKAAPQPTAATSLGASSTSTGAGLDQHRSDQAALAEQVPTWDATEGAGGSDAEGALPAIPTALRNPVQSLPSSNQRIQQPAGLADPFTAAAAPQSKGLAATSEMPLAAAAAAAAGAAAQQGSLLPGTAIQPAADTDPQGQPVPTFGSGSMDGHAASQPATVAHSTFGPPPAVLSTAPAAATAGSATGGAKSPTGKQQHTPAAAGKTPSGASGAVSGSSDEQPAERQATSSNNMAGAADASYSSFGEVSPEEPQELSGGSKTPKKPQAAAAAAEPAAGEEFNTNDTEHRELQPAESVDAVGHKHGLVRSRVKSVRGGRNARLRQQSSEEHTGSAGLSSSSSSSSPDSDVEQQEPQEKPKKHNKKQQGSRAKLQQQQQQRKHGKAEAVAKDASAASQQSVMAEEALPNAQGPGHAANRSHALNRRADTQQQDTLIVTLGDYVMRQGSFGTGVVDPAPTGDAAPAGWVSRLAAEYKGKAQVFNRGQATATSAAGVTMVEDLLKDLSDAGGRVKLVIVSFGGNDAISRGRAANDSAPRVPAAAYEANLKAIIGKLREAGIQNILLVTPPPAARRSDRPFRGIQEVSRVAADVARASNIPVVDLFAAVASLPDWQDTAMKEDGLRLSGSGQELLFKLVMHVLGSQLRSVSPAGLMSQM